MQQVFANEIYHILNQPFYKQKYCLKNNIQKCSVKKNIVWKTIIYKSKNILKCIFKVTIQCAIHGEIFKIEVGIISKTKRNWQINKSILIIIIRIE